MNIDTKKCKKSLPCRLTDKELLDAGEQMVRKTNAAHQLEAQAKMAKKDYDARIAACDAEADRLGNLLTSKVEMREVECMIEYDFDENVIRTIRLDTNEEVESRKMNEEERQRELNLWAGSDDGKRTVENARESVRELRRATVTLLERKLSVSSVYACKIIDLLAAEGLLSDPDEEGVRHYIEPQEQTEESGPVQTEMV